MNISIQKKQNSMKEKLKKKKVQEIQAYVNIHSAECTSHLGNSVYHLVKSTYFCSIFLYKLSQ